MAPKDYADAMDNLIKIGERETLQTFKAKYEEEIKSGAITEGPSPFPWNTTLAKTPLKDHFFYDVLNVLFLNGLMPGLANDPAPRVRRKRRKRK